MTTARPRRRWLRWLAVVLLAVVGWLAAMAWVLTRDRERVAGVVANAVRDASGLELVVNGAADVSFWPPGIRLGEVRLALPGGAALASADALGASVPWSVLWTREIELRRIELDGVVVDLDALSALPAARAEDGPPAPLRWPALDERLVVNDAKLVRAGAEPIIVTLEVEPIAVDTNVHFSATIVHAGRTLRISVDGVAKNDRGLALDRAYIDVDGLGFAGIVRVAGASDWSAEGQLAAKIAPPWIDENLPGATPKAPVSLDVAVSRIADSLALRADGELAGARLDVDLAGIELPESNAPGSWLAFATSNSLRGNAQVDRWQVGDVQLEGIELRAGDEAAK